MAEVEGRPGGTGSAPASASAGGPGFVRYLGVRSGVAVNMTQMCGIGPFITIPLVVAAMGGPQAVVGWVAGAVLALADGLIWAELGAAMPGAAGGTYIYLREAFQYRTGRLMPFLFVWTAVLFIPLIMSTGVIGLAGWIYVYHSAGRTAIILSGIWLAAGVVAYMIWARVVRTWPFGPKLVREVYLEQQKQQLAAAGPPIQPQ